MDSSIYKSTWDRIDSLDITPTESLILLALASSVNASSGVCHPRQDKLAQKTHLAIATVKDGLAALRKKGLVTWTKKPAHVNEYRILIAQEDAAAASGAEERVGNGKRDLPAPEASDEAKDLRLRLARFERVWKRATLLLGQTFARLIPDPDKRVTAMIDCQLLIGKRAFLSCNSLFFRLKREIKDGKHDGEDIAKLILSQLGKLPPTDDPSEPEPPLKESSLATQSENPDSVSQE